jgi:hypothetical protein
MNTAARAVGGSPRLSFVHATRLTACAANIAAAASWRGSISPQSPQFAQPQSGKEYRAAASKKAAQISNAVVNTESNQTMTGGAEDES